MVVVGIRSKLMAHGEVAPLHGTLAGLSLRLTQLDCTMQAHLATTCCFLLTTPTCVCCPVAARL